MVSKPDNPQKPWLQVSVWALARRTNHLPDVPDRPFKWSNVAVLALEALSPAETRAQEEFAHGAEVVENTALAPRERSKNVANLRIHPWILQEYRIKKDAQHGKGFSRLAKSSLFWPGTWKERLQLAGFILLTVRGQSQKNGASLQPTERG